VAKMEAGIYMHAGQAVVQFALCCDEGCHYAIKFFLDRASFEVEAALYAAAFPHIRDMVAHNSGSVRAASTCKFDLAGTRTAGTAYGSGSVRVAGDSKQPGDAAFMDSEGNKSALRQPVMPEMVARLLPQVEAVYGGVEGCLVDPRGEPLPPCIVMEKGECLQDWCDRAEPDRFAAIAVRSNIDIMALVTANCCHA